MWHITVITICPIAHDDIIRAILKSADDTTAVPFEQQTIILPNSITYRVETTIEDASHVRAEIARSINMVEMYVCEPV